MPSIAVIGTQWGDEGKAKIVDLLAQRADAVVRSSGGNNAGHSVIVAGTKYRFSSVPCGILHPHVLGIMGNGTAINPPELLAELESLREDGLAVENVRISSRAHLVMPYHLILDELMDDAWGDDENNPAGSRRGVRPCYMDKIARVGIRVCDLLDPEGFARKVRANVTLKNRTISRVYGGIHQVDAEQIIKDYLGYADRLKPYIADTGYLLYQMLSEGKRIVFEGAQATMLDPDFGTYPYVTSSHPSIGGFFTGSGVGNRQITHTLGVVKAYTTRTGRGPLPTEVFGRTADDLRAQGNEYEASGSYRRIGWFDAMALRYAARVNGLEGLALTKMNALRDFREVKLCVGYRYENEILNVVPPSSDVLAQCEPVYETMPGWGQIDGCNSFEELPERARNFISRIEELTGVPVMVVEVGMGRNKLLVRGAVKDWING